MDRNRFRGCLIGLAVGDALGMTLEFKRPGAFKPIKDMVGGGLFRLKPGEWTDDISMALCIAESLIECKGFDPADQMRRYLRWYREGYLSSNGRCFDIGNTVRQALTRFERIGEPFSGFTDSQSAGNGSIMRLAPVPVYYASDPLRAIEKSEGSGSGNDNKVLSDNGCCVKKRLWLEDPGSILPVPALFPQSPLPTFFAPPAAMSPRPDWIFGAVGTVSKIFVLQGGNL